MASILPVFVPHAGCPCRCVFCNQHAIAGQTEPMTAVRARELLEEGLSRLPVGSRPQAAFYGGSFTAIAEAQQEELLSVTDELIGAIYLDGGLEAARSFIMTFLPAKVDLAEAGHAFRDYKTALQEIVQKNRQETLQYRLSGESGPDHDKRFTVQVLLNSNIFAEGIGRSKKEAEQMAARSALELMGKL